MRKSQQEILRWDKVSVVRATWHKLVNHEKSNAKHVEHGMYIKRIKQKLFQIKKFQYFSCKH